MTGDLMTHAARVPPGKRKLVSRESVLIGRLLRLCGLMLGVLLIGGIGYHFLNMERPVEQPPSSLLVEQMELAAKGGGPKTHAFGGTLSVEKGADRITVTAAEVPQEACVNAAWVLIGKGTIAINGVIPRRVTGAILAQLCSQHGDRSTVSWSPAIPKSDSSTIPTDDR
jgi:hypothetical protein